MSDRRIKKRNNDNRRNNDRIFTDLHITTYINDEEVITKMRNISGNGMQIVEPTDIDMQVKQDCQILIQDDNASIKLDASVVWKEFGLIGLCFSKQDQSTQKQLNKLANKLSMVAISNTDLVGLG